MDNIYEYIKRAQTGDPAAKEHLVKENSGLIWAVVKRFHGRGEQDDLFQIGAIGLLKAIEKFDFEYNVKFSTYAVPLIIGEIKRFLRDDGTIKVSRNLKELSYRAKKLQEMVLKEENREITISELAEKLETDREELVLALESSKEIESIYAESTAQDQKGCTQLIEKLSDNSETEKMIDRISLQFALKNLSIKERQVIIMRFFQDRTQTDIAGIIGISQVQVSRMEKKALNQMKDSLK